MRIIAFGDIHMTSRCAHNIENIKNADLVLLNGDLTNYGGIREAKVVLDDILSLNPNVLAQFGNLDNMEVNDYLEELGLNMHGQARLVKREVCIVGLGGSTPVPFHTPSEFSEQQLKKLIDDAFIKASLFTQLAEPLHKRKIPTIFISHCPPFNTDVDTLLNGKHVGSHSVRYAIEKYQPDVCIVGHIHEAKGKDNILNTPIYNPGMLRAGGWVSIEINNNEINVTLK